jgi:hypothetical protein
VIKGIAREESVEVEISGGPEEFRADLNLIRSQVAKTDRVWNMSRQVWIISHPEQYRFIGAIDRALKEKNAQMALF